jgi:hypothetical protein
MLDGHVLRSTALDVIDRVGAVSVTGAQHALANYIMSASYGSFFFFFSRPSP